MFKGGFHFQRRGNENQAAYSETRVLSCLEAFFVKKGNKGQLRQPGMKGRGSLDSQELKQGSA